MGEGDRERWDARHQQAAPVLAVDSFVAAALDRLGPGAGRRALDLASGTGRHALELARRAWRTEAWDVSPVGLAVLAERAAAQGLEVATRTMDLVGQTPAPSGGEALLWGAQPRPFDLVVLVNFLERPLLARLPELVLPGGHLLFVTFTEDRPGTKPPLAYCLARGELARGLEGLEPFEVLAVEESAGRAGLLGRR